MDKISRNLGFTILVMITILVFVQLSSEPKFITTNPYYNIILGFGGVAIFALFILLVVRVGFPNIKVIFGGGCNYFAGTECRDNPIDEGGYICGFIITIVNKGGRKLNLEPKMVLRDWKTGQSLCSADLMPEEPLSRQISDAIIGKKHLGLQPYCPKFLELNAGLTRKHSLYFFISKAIVSRLGRAKIHNTRKDLIFYR